jgi:DNA-binding NtrC family response regulator
MEISPVPATFLLITFTTSARDRFGAECEVAIMAEPARILIVDDDRAVLLSYTIILERLGYAVTGISSSAEAQQLIRDQRFDLMVCDLSLDGGASGLQVIESARKADATLPVILMTGYSDAVIPEHLAGARILLVTKPANIPQLLDTVRSMLGNKADPTGNAAD